MPIFADRVLLSFYGIEVQKKGRMPKHPPFFVSDWLPFFVYF